MRKLWLGLLVIVISGSTLRAQEKETTKEPEHYIHIHFIRDTTDERFGIPIKEFDITVPRYYDPETYIDTSMSMKYENREMRIVPNGQYEKITGTHFGNPSCCLEPGKTYHVQIFPVMDDEHRVPIADCMKFLRKQHAIFVGAPGLLLAYDQQRQNFPRDCWIDALDDNDHLWKDWRTGSIQYPRVFIGMDEYETTDFGLANINEPLPHDTCLIVFTEKPSLANAR